MISNTTKTPLSTDPLGAGSYGCPPNPPGPDPYGALGFLVDVNVNNLNAVKSTSLFSGRFAHGTSQ